MEPKKQRTRQPNETTSAARKPPAAPMQTGSEASPPTTPASSSQQGMAGNQGATRQGAGDQDLLQHAKQAGGDIMNKVQEQAGSQLSRQKESAANDLTQVVDAVRRLGQSLAGEQNGPIARYAAQYGDKAAEQLERFSTYIREQDPKQLLNDVQNFGRRRPALLIGGAFLLGFAGARLIKTSMNAQSQQQHSFQSDVRPATPSTMPKAL